MPAKKPQTDWEKAARALCRFDGHPENILMDGRPMWMSYLAEAKAVLEAIDQGPDEVAPLSSRD
jgi:hypothetical protein